MVEPVPMDAVDSGSGKRGRVGREGLGGSPEGSVEGVDGGLLESGLGEEIAERAAHAGVDGGEVGEDAAGVGDFDGEVWGLVEATPGGGDLDGEVVAGEL